MSLEVDAKLDPIEWLFFLQMLSSERTEPFLRELALPFEREQFPDVMRLARACLEVQMLPSIQVLKNTAGPPDLIKAWEKYRRVAGVLDDETLQHFLECYDRSKFVSQVVFVKFREWIGADTANALNEWFKNNFRSSPDPTWQWPWALRLLFTDDPQKVTPSTPAPITEDESQRIKSFCTRFGFKRRALESRFWVIKQAATATLPTLWEFVLQTFPDSMGNHYPWLGYVEECLQFSLIRREWNKLEEELGANVMAQLIEWVKQQEELLPYNTVLPNEPN